MIGFIASAVSDSCSNFIRVIKITKQVRAIPTLELLPSDDDCGLCL